MSGRPHQGHPSTRPPPPPGATGATGAVGAVGAVGRSAASISSSSRAAVRVEAVGDAPARRALSEDEVRGKLERLASIGAKSAEVAHELRNALSVLETSLHLLRRAFKGHPEVAAKAELQLRRMAEQIHAGQSIVREVLEDTRDHAERTTVELSALVLEVVAGVARPESITVDVDVPRARVHIDGRQVRQLLLNLLRNAVEAMEQAGRAGVVRVVARVDPPELLLLRVDDEGPGIDASIAARLFEAFATAKVGGTGLGLALCRRIARAHGGDIVARSRSPRGTSMEVTLPLPAKAPSEPRQRRHEPR